MADLDPVTLRWAAAHLDALEQTARRHITPSCECRHCLLYTGHAAMAASAATAMRTQALREVIASG